MPSMTPMMSLIFLLLALMSCMVDTTCDTTSPPRAATSAADVAIGLAVWAESEVCFTVLVSASMLLAVVCGLLAVSSVRWQVVVALRNFAGCGGNAVGGRAHFGHQLAQRGHHVGEAVKHGAPRGGRNLRVQVTSGHLGHDGNGMGGLAANLA